MNRLALILAIFLAAPLAATSEEARSSEARACQSALKDLLIHKYHESGNRADVHWTIADILGERGLHELNGSYFSYENYSVRWPDDRENVAILSCRDVWSGQQGVTDLELEVDLTSGAERFSDPPKSLVSRLRESLHIGWLEITSMVGVLVVAIALLRCFVARRKKRQT
jgi:hypothetical protein